VCAFRVTERSIATNVLAGLQGNLGQLGKIQQRMSTGKQISKPSDSPTGTMTAMQYRSDIATAKQYARNADDGVAWLGTADTALSSVATQVERARELVLQGMSDGAGSSPDARAALAAEIDQIQESTIGTANTKYLDRPIFGGTTTGATAYDSAGNYVGDNGTVQRTVGDNTQVQVALSGDTVFGTGSGQLFSVMSDIANDLRSNPSGLAGDLQALDAATSTLKTAQSTIGARYNQVTQLQQVATDKVTTLTGQLSDVEDIDLPKTLTDLSLQQTAYQAALAAGSKIVQQSLLDFLR
jgi:flagellar hook-associated protein 3 FlgL